MTLVLAVVGCGGSGGSGGSNSSPNDYFKAVTKLGNDLATSLENVQSQVSTATSKSAALADMSRLTGFFEDAARKLGSLSPPSSVRQQHATALADLRQTVNTLHADIQAGNLDKATSDYSTLGNEDTSAILNISVKGP